MTKQELMTLVHLLRPLRGSSVKLYLTMLALRDRAGIVTMTHKELGEAAEVADRSTYRSMIELIDEGLVVLLVCGRGRSSPNVYMVHDPLAEQKGAK